MVVRSRDRTTSCPNSELLDLLGSGCRKRHCPRQRINQRRCCHRLLAGERGIECCLYDGLNFRARVAPRCGGNLIQIKLRRTSIPPLQLKRKYLLSLRLVWQVDKKQFVKPPFANQFGRKHGNIVAGGRYEDWSFALLHPGKKRTQQTR